MSTQARTLSKEQKQYGRTPKDVLKNAAISSDAVRVFTALNMQGFGAQLVAISCRELARLVPMKKSKIGKVLKTLEKCGLLERLKSRRGQVGAFRINHILWADAEPEKSIECPRCHAKGFTAGVSGACQKCIASLRDKLAAKVSA